jgi:hypothetical protein
MPMESVEIELLGSNLQLGDMAQVVLVVDAVAQHVAEVAKRAFQRVRGPLFLSFLEGGSFAFAVLDVAVADILVVRAILERHAHNDRQTQVHPEGLWMLIGEVDLDVLDSGGPPIEAEYFICEGDAFFGGDVVNLLAGWASTIGQVLWAKLLLESALERRNLLGRVFRDPFRWLDEGIANRVVLLAWATKA